MALKRKLFGIERKEKCKFGHPLVFVPTQKRLRCYECDKVRHKKYYFENKDKIRVKARDRQLRYLYGITQEEYYRLLLSQNSQCSICGKVHSERSLVVDHNHYTGEIRGLLCSQCNFMIGLADENNEILRRAMEYLTKKL
jgi:hypothetical protein